MIPPQIVYFKQLITQQFHWYKNIFLFLNLKQKEFHYYTAFELYLERLIQLINWRQQDLKNRNDQNPPNNELNKCCICQEELFDNILDFDFNQLVDQLRNNKDDDPIQLKQCDGHGFHKSCILSYIGKKQWIKCPICMKIYGIMQGDQPDGSIYTYEIKEDCEGYKGVGTIVIEYKIQSCVINSVQLFGTSRVAYLPNTPEGKEVRDLLKKCFNRKLTFTIGTSVTTGVKNSVIWNGIHHKTSMTGGSSNYGYPDKTYLTRVKEELAAKGIK